MVELLYWMALKFTGVPNKVANEYIYDYLGYMGYNECTTQHILTMYITSIQFYSGCTTVTGRNSVLNYKPVDSLETVTAGQP